MNEERKEGGVRHVEPTLLRPITVAVASRADSSLISGLVGAKRPSFPAGPPATRLLSPPLCSGEVFLESQQHGDQFLKAAPFSTFQHLSISSSASSSSLHMHCTGSQGPPNHPCWFCGTPPQPTALSSSESPDSWLVLMDHPHQPYTYVQRPPHLWVHQSSCLNGPKAVRKLEFGGAGGAHCRVWAPTALPSKFPYNQFPATAVTNSHTFSGFNDIVYPLTVLGQKSKMGLPGRRSRG